MPVLDASVCVALFNQAEAGHLRSRAFVHAAAGRAEPLRAPVIVLAEVAAALSRGVGDKSLAEQAVRILQSGWLQLQPVTLALAEQAAAIAATHQVRGCDAVYLALAQQERDTLVTWDRQQLQRGAGAVSTQEP